MTFLPPDITLLEATLLVVISAFTSGISAVMSIGGGVAYLAVLASIIPPAAVIPIHGAVQIGNNASRAWIQRAHIAWPIAVPFVLGSIAGAILGGQVVFALPEDVLRIVLGGFILYMVWGKMQFRFTSGERARSVVSAVVGAASTFLTMFIGATGPFVASSLGHYFADRMVFVGSHALCMLFQHTIKVVVFGILGFAFGPWIPLLALIILSGIFGTVIGSRFLARLPEETFRKALKIILTVLALNLLAAGFGLYS
ncbi:MAG: sulfite exporter TauE/SafE family protein [Alphaproteobacteria bacterium]|nr:sulfite exporter TauE/SafE family protein [Alphaproteobacteria bacterium]